MRRGAKLYYVAAGVSQVCALLRYTLLARMLGPEQLGLAATIILTAQFFDSVTDSGADRFLVQNRDGERPSVQRLVHLVSIGRGVLTAVSLVVFSQLLARLFGAEALAAGFIVLAAAPLAMGFLHLDLRRLQREEDFRPEAVSLLAAECISLAITIIAALLVRDFTAILYGLIGRAVVMVVASHLTAQRPYGIGFDKDHAAALGRFALPLMLNGLLLFFGSQGDRIFVANRLGVTELGYYSTALMLLASPAAVVTRAFTTFHLPRVASGRDDPPARQQASEALGGQSVLLGLAAAAGFALVGPVVVVLLFGRAYAQSSLVMALVAVLVATRFVRIWPTTTALALGRTEIALGANIVRLLSFPAAAFAFLHHGALPGVLAGFIAGEFTALAVAMLLVNRATAMPPLYGFARFALFLAGSFLIPAWANVAPQPTPMVVGGLLLATVGLLVVIQRRERATIADGLLRLAGLMKRAQALVHKP